MPRSWYIQGMLLAVSGVTLGVFGLVVSVLSTAPAPKAVGGLLAGIVFYQTFSAVRLMLRERREEREYQARMQESAALVASLNERMRQRAQRVERWP